METTTHTHRLHMFILDWAGTSKVQIPITEKVVADLAGDPATAHLRVELAIHDVEKEPALAQRYNVPGAPMHVLTTEGPDGVETVVRASLGMRTHDRLRRFILEGEPEQP